ncbi:hypothetical protein HanIR_Chr03g0149581 [Helianthus annuus]|nr:hypothetical protein HanIR_Chr03g0149581 [Helianthus annuus]
MRLLGWTVWGSAWPVADPNTISPLASSSSSPLRRLRQACKDKKRDRWHLLPLENKKKIPYSN